MTSWRGPLLILIGFALGAVLVLIGPRPTWRYLPEALRGKLELVEGEVPRRGRPAERLGAPRRNRWVSTFSGYWPTSIVGKLLDRPAALD